ncbi:MAG: OmpA family protein [Vicinamibacterales bacterium]
MLRSLGVFAGFVAFPFLCYHCVTADGPAIQSRLQSIVATAEATAAVTGVDVVADGREIVLTGSVPTQEMRVRAGFIASALPGVRTVDNRLTVAPPQPPAAAPATAPSTTPAPSASASDAQQQITRILLDKRVQFETAKDVLLPVSIPVLDEVAGVLKGAPQLSVTIEGHTDNVGDAAANRALSEARARAVVQWLGQHGIEQSRLHAEGFGPDRPVAPNTTSEGRARNRRVDIIAR